MESSSPRGSKRGAEEVRPAELQQPSQDLGEGVGEQTAMTGGNQDRREQTEEGAGDAAARKGDLELCKRDEV